MNAHDFKKQSQDKEGQKYEENLAVFQNQTAKRERSRKKRLRVPGDRAWTRGKKKKELRIGNKRAEINRFAREGGGEEKQGDTQGGVMQLRALLRPYNVSVHKAQRRNL